MVAYSFQRQFVEPIRSLRKLHTIRGPRQRHARSGEWMQRYAGMRTHSCEKIILDPICSRVMPIHLDLWRDDGSETIQITGIFLDRPAREHFAIMNGFDDLAAMRAFWLKHHGRKPFDGVLITWAPAP